MSFAHQGLSSALEDRFIVKVLGVCETMSDRTKQRERLMEKRCRWSYLLRFRGRRRTYLYSGLFLRVLEKKGLSGRNLELSDIW